MDSKDSEPGNGEGHIQDFIFVRELSEVYLLLDHISGRWDKSLYRAQPDQPERRDPNWIETICKIGWPVQGTKVEVADQAAVLLRAKDRLNAVARPATGATVAFTLMVVGEDRADTSWWRKLFSPREARPDAVREPAHDSNGAFARPPTRLSLARTAFPGLLTTAARFERRIKTIVWMLFAWLIVTCMLSWNVTVGGVILTHLDKVNAQGRDIAKQIVTAEISGADRAGAAGTLLVAARADDRQLLVRLCERPLFLTPVSANGNRSVQRFNTVEEIHLCDALRENQRERATISANLASLVSRWSWLRLGLDRGPQLRSQEEKAGEDEEWIRILTQLMANSVLPLCYGILGAGAAVVRDLWAKMRESTLSPRDYPLALGQLSLGAVIGACIGLFISPAGATADGLFAGVALTGSALSFIAGFGVEGVFVALESLVRRVFNMPPAAEKR
ncbi:MAG: hypothetical protein V4631_16740 [Pseudomonadota bacterium]